MASWCKVVWIQTSTYRFDLRIRRTSPLQFESTGTNIEEVFIYSLHPSKLRICWLRCLVKDPLGMLKRFCSGGFGSILIEISSLLRVSTNQKQSGLAFSGRRSMSIPTWNGQRLCNQINDSIPSRLSLQLQYAISGDFVYGPVPWMCLHSFWFESYRNGTYCGWWTIWNLRCDWNYDS